jgi:hypothetical protein
MMMTMMMISFSHLERTGDFRNFRPAINLSSPLPVSYILQLLLSSSLRYVCIVHMYMLVSNFSAAAKLLICTKLYVCCGMDSWGFYYGGAGWVLNCNVVACMSQCHISFSTFTFSYVIMIV